MASGTPDYIREVREKFGAGKIATGSLVVTANSLNELLSITGKGVIYGGFVYQTSLSSQRFGITYLVIDSLMSIGSSYWFLNNYNITIPNSYPMTITKYDEVDYQYAVTISPAIKFESSFKLYYQETQGAAPTIYYSINYALL